MRQERRRSDLREIMLDLPCLCYVDGLFNGVVGTNMMGNEHDGSDI